MHFNHAQVRIVNALARYPSVGEKRNAAVAHATGDVFHALTRALVRAYDLYSPVILGVYPLRMDRGKQPEKAIRLFSQLEAAGQSVRLLVASFHSTGRHFLAYRDEIREEAHRLGLDDEEVLFTNRLDGLPGIDPGDMARWLRGWSESWPINDGMSNAVDSPVWP